ncbi:MAG: heavy metal translocating P-type ATPase [Rhodospirillales bacterium]|nr:heavy metal translocating P-type ATPase [Rhodospirillales bacterium]
MDSVQVLNSKNSADLVQTVILPVKGMTCAACSGRIEKVVGRLSGITEIIVNLAAEQAKVSFNSEELTTSDVVQSIEKTGFSVPPQKHMITIKGMTCAACVGRVEKVLNRLPGITSAQVNLATEQAVVEGQTGVISAADIVSTIEKTGFGAQIIEGDEPAINEDEQAAADRREYLIFMGAALLTLPMVLQMVWDLAGIHWMLPPLVQLALATPVQFIAGARFYRSAWGALRAGSGNMDLLVAMGTSAAYGLSLFVLLRPDLGSGYLYFEASAAVITLVLLGKILETRAKRGTTAAIKALMKLRPETANVEKDGREIEVPASSVASGDIVVVRPGERLPVDGIVAEGGSQVDESLITGESLPVEKGIGKSITGGALNGEGLLKIRATNVGAASTLSRIIEMVQGAQASKAPVQKLVDRIAEVFVPAVVLIAFVTLVGWLIYGVPMTEAVIAAVSVLVIACPCALGLATPTAIMVGTGAAAKAGILIKDADALERAKNIDTVVFDKTGTLTQGKPVVWSSEALTGSNDDLVRLTASAQQGSQHPLAKAILAKAPDNLMSVSDFQSLSGKGLKAKVDNCEVAIGNRLLMAEEGVETLPLEDQATASELKGGTVMWVASSGDLLGIIAVGDEEKEHAQDAVKTLKQQGVMTVMLTGDNKRTAQAVAERLGIENVVAEVLPEHKSDEVMRLKGEGRSVAMVGDGINDAPALAAADVGMAMGTGTDVAMETAGITLMRGEPGLVADAISISQATYSKIKQNLFWAFFYNVIALPLAAFGFLSPMVAGAAMAMSSVSVVSNSLLLRNWRPKQ